jgi:hypothetical protein
MEALYVGYNDLIVLCGFNLLKTPKLNCGNFSYNLMQLNNGCVNYYN